MTPHIFMQTPSTAAADTTGQKILNIEETISKLAEMPTGELFTFLAEKGINIGLKILAAIIIYSVGAWLIRKIKRITRTILEKRNIEQSLSSFILSFISLSLTVLLVVITVQTPGVDTSSFVALLAGGIMLIIFKPFKVGDYIEAQGYEGTVESIQIAATVLKTADNMTITLPNGALSGGTVNNYSTSTTRRCDWNINIPYGSDFNKAKELIYGILESSKLVLDTPSEPFIGIGAMDNGFDFPIPKMDVNILTN